MLSGLSQAAALARRFLGCGARGRASTAEAGFHDQPADRWTSLAPRSCWARLRAQPSAVWRRTGSAVNALGANMHRRRGLAFAVPATRGSRNRL